MTRKILFALSILLCCPLSVGAGEVKKDLRAAVVDSKAAIKESKKDFEKRFKETRKELKASIAHSQKKATKLHKEARAEMNKKIEALKDGLKDLDAKEDKMDRSGKESWENFKDGVDKAANDLKKACQDIADSFK